ncbi:phosphopantothenoylcysteine decarboxylase [Pseudomonadota bacterium]
MKIYEKNQNLKILITAGPTYEPIDPVRFICNRSSGKQGVAIAKVFAEFGFEVNLVLGPISEELLNAISSKIKIYKVETAEEMLTECLKLIEKNNIDIAIFTAAVCDYRIKDVAKNKIKKQEYCPLKNIEFVENPDILKTVAAHKFRPKVVIGFVAETENLIKNAKKKLNEKNCDFVVANNVSRGEVFGEDYNKIFILDKTGDIEEYPLALKTEIADVVVQRALKEIL